jgi:hypothetical protein
MFEIKRISEGALDSHEIYLNGKLFSTSGYFSSEDEIVAIDDYLDFDINDIAEMEAIDFPDNFCFSWRAELSPLFQSVDITRKGDKLNVELAAIVDLNSFEYPWLLWNPAKFLQAMADVAIQKGYTAKTYVNGDNASIGIDFAVKGTIGSIFKKALQAVLSIQDEAETKLLMLAQQRVKSLKG